MKILYFCDKLTSFILNEIIELKKPGNDVFIWANSIHNVLTKPILDKNGLLDKTFCRFSFGYRGKIKKLIYLIKKLIYDFSIHPIITIKALIYMLKIYSNLGNGTKDYINIRYFFGLKIDLIHAPFSTPSIIDKVYFSSKIFNVPFTLAFRAHDIYQDDNLRKAQKKIDIIREASQIITISNYNKKHIESAINTKKNIEIVHSAINIDFLKPKDVDNVDRPNKSIIAVCRLTEEKGIIYLIKACHILKKRKIEYDCTIIGDGPEKGTCEKLIDELLIPNINFTGYLTYDEVREYLNHSTVFVLPSVIASNRHRDILANGLKEAMAMELPVIASDICGIEELIDNGISGILVPSRDPEAIADAIEKVFNYPNVRKRMGEAGRKKIEKDFNIKIEVSKLERIFREAVKKPSAIF